MPNLLIIFGITGQQGSSVANHILSDPILSKTYNIRGITRDPNKAEAQAFQSQGVELVKCDLDDRSSIKAALKDAHTVYAMTATMYKPGGMDQELAQGKAIADEAVAAGVRFFVYSSVPSPRKISGGKYHVDSFDIKDEVKDYVQSLPLKSAFFWPGCKCHGKSCREN